MKPFNTWLESKIPPVSDITDFRNPYKDEWRRKPDEPHKLAGKFVILGATETFAFYWGDPNFLPWGAVLKRASAILATSKVQKSITEILLTPERNVIIDDRQDDTRWPGEKNRYTRTLLPIAKELLRRRIVNKTSKLYVGNWAGQWGNLVGTIQEILTAPEIPDQLTLYHGTNNFRAEEILANGLKPVPLSQRMWKGRADKGHPEYRDEAVYLSASPSQAAQYAQRAVNMARRHGVLRSKPIVLQVIINKEDYPKLRPDDDFLEKRPDAGREDWHESLSYFGQVALVGSVPPNQISVAKAWESKEQMWVGAKNTLHTPVD